MEFFMPLTVTGTSRSLVPRLFPPPVFDHSQYANLKGEGMGDLVMCNDIGRQMVDTEGSACLTIIIPVLRSCQTVPSLVPC